jgi:hypothetical protein
MTLDLRLYALIDPAVAGGRALGDIAARIAGSATLVQLRDKHGSTRAMVEEARELTVVLAPLDIPLLINDRVDVALAAEADGVHIGQDDMSPADARLLLGRTAIIGLSIKTVQQAKDAALEHRRRLRHHVQGQSIGADRPRWLARRCRGHSRARYKNPDLRHRRHQRGQRRGRDRARRRWRGGDLGAVAGGRSGASGARASRGGRRRPGAAR